MYAALKMSPVPYAMLRFAGIYHVEADGILGVAQKEGRTEVTARPLTLGALLVRSRKRAGLSQEGLAEQAAVSVHTISNLETGRGHMPRQATIDLLLTALANALPHGPAELDDLRAAFREAAGVVDVQRQPAEKLVPPVTTVPSTGMRTVLVCALVPGRDGQIVDVQARQALLTLLADACLKIVPSLGGRPADPLDGLGGAAYVFDRADDALRAAILLEKELQPAQAPRTSTTGDPPHCCLALHSGWAAVGSVDGADPTRRRAVRLALLGHGGQVLLSQAACDQVAHALPDGVRLHTVGHHQFSVVERPQPLYQVLQSIQPANYPSPRSPSSAPHNLPVQPTSFIGREREQAAVAAMVSQAPLVTLVGAGGCGKTRLALHVAADQLERYAGGVWLVELAALGDPALVPQAVATALRIREETGRPLTETLVDLLHPTPLLLLLDNCEHLLGACAALASTLLQACPHLHILATSRERLGIGVETTYRVPSLSLPITDRQDPGETPAAYEGVRLFVERARASTPSFVLTEQNAGAVTRICRRLDGIPLAIELAAARVRSRPVETIAAQLDDTLPLLTGGPRDVPSRHQTLRAALDWSWDLLNDEERMLLRRLSVFAAGCTAQAAAAVCAGVGLEDLVVPEVLEALADKSLVVMEDAGADTRYTLLETVRQYCAGHVQLWDERLATQHSHLDWYLHMAEQIEPTLGGSEQQKGLDALEREHDNVRAALAYAREQGDGERGLRLVAALWRFWNMRGYLTEARGWLEQALTRESKTFVPPAARARALNGAGNLADSQGDYAQATSYHEEALTLQRALGDTMGIATSLNGLGNAAQKQGNYSRAEALHEEALALRRAAADQSSIAASLSNLGIALYLQGKRERAVSLLDEALVLKRALGDTWGTAATLNNLGQMLNGQGQHARSQAMHEEALALRRALGDVYGAATSLRNLGISALERRDYDRATVLLQEALTAQRSLGDKMGIADALGNLAVVAYRRGDHSRAATLFIEGILLSHEIGVRDVAADLLECLSWVVAARGRAREAVLLAAAAEGLRADLGVALTDVRIADHEHAVTSMRAALDEGIFAAAWIEGRTLILAQTINLVIQESGL